MTADTEVRTAHGTARLNLAPQAASHGDLASALAAFQRELPRIGKGNEARVETSKGPGYSYRYADLADVSAAVLPALARHGLSWSCRPTMSDDGGRFALLYELRHETGEVLDGVYPLPAPSGRAQDIGSAITYARRYALCSVTGVAPADDDDDAAAASGARYTEPQAPPPPAEITDHERAVLRFAIVDDLVRADKPALAALWKEVGRSTVLNDDVADLVEPYLEALDLEGQEVTVRRFRDAVADYLKAHDGRPLAGNVLTDPTPVHAAEEPLDEHDRQAIEDNNAGGSQADLEAEAEQAAHPEAGK